MFRIEAHCKCGLENFNREDWLSHWKHGVVKQSNRGNKHPDWMMKYPKIRAIYFFLFTEIRIIHK